MASIVQAVVLILSEEVFALSKLRVVFKKCEGLRYVGHLDILRTFSRVLRRIDFPLKYSEGFNPHPVMTFILPTGVGVTSDCEMVDIGITEEPDIAKFISNFNSHTAPDSLEVVSAEITDTKMPEIEKAEYIIEIINENPIDEAELLKALEMPEIMVDKKSKKQIKQVNIKEHIFDYKIIEINGNVVKLKMILSAGNTFNIKPVLVIQGITSVCENLSPLAVKPSRTKYFMQILSI